MKLIVAVVGVFATSATSAIAKEAPALRGPVLVCVVTLLVCMLTVDDDVVLAVAMPYLSYITSTNTNPPQSIVDYQIDNLIDTYTSGHKRHDRRKSNNNDESTVDDRNVETLKEVVDSMGSDAYWHANEIMQYEIAPDYPQMPAFAREEGYVSSVDPIPDNEKKAFHEEYLYHEKRSFRTDPFDEVEARACQFDRLDWVQKNPDIFVNQLRESGFDDEEITGIITGSSPNGFKSKELYEEFKEDLYSRGVQCLEKDTDMKNMVFTFSGSSAVSVVISY